MAEYFAAQMTKAAISAVRYGVRDLRNGDLLPFYDGPPVPASEVTTRVAASQEIGARAGGPAVNRGIFLDQAGAPNPRFFTEYVEAAGIELTYASDLFETTDEAQQPSSDFLSSFIDERSDVAVTPPVVAASLPTSVTSGTVQHLTVPPLYALADADSYVRLKVQNMRQYINRYLQPR